MKCKEGNSFQSTISFLISRHRSYLFLLLAYSFMFIACGSDRGIEPEAPPTGEEESGQDVTLYVTTSSRSFDLNKQTTQFNSKTSMSPLTVTLMPTTTFQTMDGFGVAITGSTCFNLLQMKKEDRTAFLTQTFSPESGFGFSYVRISIGCSDFSLSEYTCCDTKGIENFALQSEEKNYIIPILKEILAVNPTLKIMGTPWTCPRWMKVNNLTDKQPFNSWTSGRLHPDYYQDYATYFVKWIKAFAQEGINIYSITPQNEPLNDGNSASLHMEWQEERDFVKTALGPQLKNAGINAKIYAWDHNFDAYEYPLNIYADTDANAYLAGAAFHDYAGSNSVLDLVHRQYPDKELLFTESSIGEWNAGRNLEERLLKDMDYLILGNVTNWCKGVIVWNLMLDSDRGPHRGDEGGCPTCYGAVDIGYDYKTITRNSHYYVIAHIASVVKPGAVRISTSGYEDTTGAVRFAAFQNTDKSYAFIAINKQNEEKTIVVNDGKHNFTCKLPAKSVVSSSWK